MPVSPKHPVIEYEWRTRRPFAQTLGGPNYDVLPCEVEFSVTFKDGKTELEFEKMVRGWLEEHGA
jgi:hypothetical protein